jgi:uncharacterized protein involved in response to NO
MTARLFAYGFRPFFLGVGLSALVFVPMWVASFSFGLPLGTGWPPMLWHAHEMLFGFSCAAIAGFLLTAVPSWTKQKGFAGGPLMLMSGLWLLGRLIVGSSTSWPFGLVAAADLAFLPVLAAFLAWPLIREHNRNTPLLLVLLVLWLCNATFHLGLFRGDLQLARQALLTGINFLLILVTVIGGRITPSFTASAMRQRGVSQLPRTWPPMATVTVALMIAVAGVDLLMPGSTVAGWVALAAAVAQGARLVMWQGHRTLRDPIVWILHLGYAWLPIGLALKALALLVGVTGAAFWLHALTIGAIATMILGVMTRVALGHTGRPLQVHPLIKMAYLLVSAAAVARVFGARVPWIGYRAVIAVSAALWMMAFAAFLWVYGPILLSPRVDGKPG